MAGDWIKVQHCTPDKPEVIRLAALMKLDQDAIVGKLLRIWIWTDQHSMDGNDLCVTDQFLDRLVSAEGFAVALRTVGWLSGRDGRLTIPNFERHNGQTSKARALTACRVAHHRNARDACNGDSVTQSVTQALPEKIREEKSETAIKRLDKRAMNGEPEGNTAEAEAENEFMLWARGVLGKAEMGKNGGIWRTLYRQNAGKAGRVMAEVEAVMRERPDTVQGSLGAFAMDLWKRFK